MPDGLRQRPLMAARLLEALVTPWEAGSGGRHRDGMSNAGGGD
jgi:hypothetical protein